MAFNELKSLDSRFRGNDEQVFLNPTHRRRQGACQAPPEFVIILSLQGQSTGDAQVKPSIGFSKRRLAPVLALLVAMLLAPCATQATPLIINIVQQGNDVVATGSGAINMPSYQGFEYDVIETIQGNVSGTGSALIPDKAGVAFITSVGVIDGYGVFVDGPLSFGSGSPLPATSSSGDLFGFEIYRDTVSAPSYFPGSYSEGLFFVPHGYTFGDALSFSATWANSTFASLGLTPGTYTWTVPTLDAMMCPPQCTPTFTNVPIFTIDIGTMSTSVPEPAALGTFGLGLLLIGGFVTLRRRESLSA